MKKGSHISEFHREKISAAQRGKKLTAEHKAKNSLFSLKNDEKRRKKKRPIDLSVSFFNHSRGKTR